MGSTMPDNGCTDSTDVTGLIAFTGGSRPSRRVPWQRTLIALDTVLFAAAQTALMVAFIGVHEGDTRWGVWLLPWPWWAVAASVVSMAWYVLTGFVVARSDFSDDAEPRVTAQGRLSWRARVVGDRRTRLPGVRFVALLTLPLTFAGFSQLPSGTEGEPYFNPGVFLAGWLLVILVVLLQAAGGAWPAASGVALWLPWAWYAQAGDEWSAFIAGALGLLAQVAVFAAVV
jgi:hypothetical protein